MNISPIKFNSVSLPSKVSFNGGLKLHFPKLRQSQKDTFEKSASSAAICEHKCSRVDTSPYGSYPFGYSEDLAEYQLCSNREIEKIYSSIDKKTIEAAQESIEMAKILSRGFQEKNPEDFALVSIGTSPSGIMRALDYMGYDVRYMPISNLEKITCAERETFTPEYEKEYFDFLSSIGLNEKMNKGNKNFIFYDYTYSGKTLGSIEKIAYQNGVSPDKVRFKSINNELESLAENKNEETKIKDYIFNYLTCSYIECFSGIPHVPYMHSARINDELEYYSDVTGLSRRQIKKIDDEIDRRERADTKDFNFALCYELEKQGYFK